ncbi:MAG: asparagine synthase (glutamine-hydrolyzing) [Sedimenticola sp.]
MSASQQFSHATFLPKPRNNALIQISRERFLTMCGVAGIYGYTGRQVDREELLRIRDSMVARGPDSAGLWLSDDATLGLAHRRLSILDLSSAGAQPMADSYGNVVVFNGEIYNYPELRLELEKDGCVFSSHADTEVLLHLYKKHGEAMLQKLRGMYAFAIWDSADKSLFLARDPMGIKPLYYADNGGTFRFASQVKALLAGDVDTGENPAGHVGFFLWGSVPEPYTLYRGIHALPAGHSMRVGKRGAGDPGKFSSIAEVIADADPVFMEKGEALEAISDAIRDSIDVHGLADVQVGTFLSSGLDSTLIASCVASSKWDMAERLRTITLGFEEYFGTENDEAPLAERVAGELDAVHSTVRVRKSDFSEDYQHLLSAMDQPSIDGVNTWFVSKAAASQGLKVALSGLGGDELFASYPSFTDIPRIRKASGLLSSIPGFGRAFRILTAPVIKRFTSPKYAGLFEYGGSPEGAYLLRRGLYMPWELMEFLDPEFVRSGWQVLNSRLKVESPASAITSKRMQISAMEMTWYMRNQLLRDSDWAGMAHSLEIRVPLVDLQLLKTVAPILSGCPEISKREVAEKVAPGLPSEILERPKTGFSIPVRSWLAEGAEYENGRGLRGWARHVYALANQGY